MARLTWGGIKSEATLELRNRTDISTRVENWLREAYQETVYGYRFYETEKSVTFVQGVGDSDATLSSVASDLKHIFSLRDTTNKRKLEKAHFRWLDKRQVSSGIPTHYCRFGGEILFDAAPTVAITYKLRYRKVIVEPVFTGSVFPETPSEWDEVIRLLAVARGYDALLEPEMALSFENRAARLIAKLPTDEVIEAEDDDMGVQVRMS